LNSTKYVNNNIFIHLINDEVSYHSSISTVRACLSPASAMQSRERSMETSQRRSQGVQLSEACQAVDNEPVEGQNAEEKGVNGD